MSITHGRNKDAADKPTVAAGDVTILADELLAAQQPQKIDDEPKRKGQTQAEGEAELQLVQADMGAFDFVSSLDGSPLMSDLGSAGLLSDGAAGSVWSAGEPIQVAAAGAAPAAGTAGAGTAAGGTTTVAGTATATGGAIAGGTTSGLIVGGAVGAIVIAVGGATAFTPNTSSTSNTTDTTAPTVSTVTLSSATGAQNSTLNSGDTVTATVTFNEAVTVTGTPQLALNIGGTTVQANYAAGSGTGALTFTYTITGETDANGISIDANSLALNSGTIKDAAGNAATLTHTAVTDNASYLVDTTAPTVDTVALTASTGAQNSTLNAGDTVTATVTFNEAVTVTGTPQLALNIGGTTVQANYAAGSGTGALTFTYTITGETDANGISIDANSLALNSGTIKDAAGNAATLTHTAVTDNASYLVDTTVPTVTDGNISISGASGTGGAYKVGDTVTATWNNTAGGDNNSDTMSGVTVDFSAFGGGAAVAASNSAGSWTATYTITEDGGGSIDGTNLNVSVTATDNAGNSATTADTSNATVDNDSPVASATTATIDNTQNATVQSTETGTAYLVDSGITVNSLTDITGAADSAWNQATISTPNSDTSLAATGLADGTYKVYTVDDAGNLSAASTNSVTLSTPPPGETVIFDFTTGTRTDSQGNGAFDGGTTYDITIKVNAASPTLTIGTITQMTGAINLGADDTIKIVGAGGTSGEIVGGLGGFATGSSKALGFLSLKTLGGNAATLGSHGVFVRNHTGGFGIATLWTGTVHFTGAGAVNFSFV